MKAHIYPGRPEPPDWNNIDCLQQNRMPPHAYLIQFPDFANCMHARSGNQRHVSPYVVMLSGTWQFISYPSINRLPENFLSLRAGFHPVSVPFCWPYPGTGDEISEGERFPFPIVLPRVPDDVPVGIYRRLVKLPLLLGGLRKRMVFQGVSGAFHLYVNGKVAGYSRGGFLPIEFDITNLLHDGDNELLVLVYGHHAGSYLDNHENPRMIGIFRDVYIEAVPSVTVYDSQIRTLSFDGGETWRLEMFIDLISYRISTESPQVRIRLYDEDSLIHDAHSRVSLKPGSEEWHASPVQAVAHVHLATELTGIEPWTAETPKLYQLFISVEDRQGRELSCVCQTIGFREVHLDHGRLRLNGVIIQLLAARRSTHHPQKGRVITIDDMIAEIRQMKRLNINTILTTHEPVDPIYLELCDIYGLYVLPEAECVLPRDQQGVCLENDLMFRPVFLDKAEHLVKTGKNHPSVLCWSMAGEGLSGQNHEAMRQLVQTLDSTRPVLIGLPTLDVPHSLPRSNLCFQQHPVSDLPINLKELSQHYQPIQMEAIDAENGAFILVNRRCFTHAGDLSARFSVLRDGLEVLQGVLDNLRIEPGDRRFIEIPYGDLKFDDGSEYYLRITFELTEPNIFAPAGHVVGFHEFSLMSGRTDIKMVRPFSSGTRLRLERDRHVSILSGSRFYQIFNHMTGTFDACRYGEKELFCALMPSTYAGPHPLSAGPRAYLAFGPGTNPNLPGMSGQDLFDPRRFHHLTQSIETACDGLGAVIESVSWLASIGRKPSFKVISRYEMNPQGVIRLFFQVHSVGPLPVQPSRIGIRMFLRSEFTQAAYYGKGPHAGDRFHCLSQQTGIHRLTVAPVRETLTDRPQSESHLSVRYLKLQDEQGFGVLITGDRPFCFSARPHFAEDLVEATIGSALPTRPFVEVILDEEIAESRTSPNSVSFSMSYTLTPIVS